MKMQHYHETVDELWESVVENNIDKVACLLKEKKVNPNNRHKDRHFTNPHKATALILACDKQYYDIVELLLTNEKRPADVNIADSNGVRPIWVAVEKKDIKLTRLLLTKAKVDLEFVKIFNKRITPLIRAVQLGSTDMVRELLRGGADINVRKLIHRRTIESTPLMVAVELRNIDMCVFLLNARCDVNVKVKDAASKTTTTTALLTALKLPQETRHAFLELLLSYGAIVAPETDVYREPMRLAAKENCEDIVNCFMKYGYNLQKDLNVYPFSANVFSAAINDGAEVCCLEFLKWGAGLHQWDDRKFKDYFNCAARRGQACLGTMMAMIEIYPGLLQQDWVVDKIYPGKIVSRSAETIFHKWIQETRKSPMCLQQLCKARIIRQLGSKHPLLSHHPHIPTNINKLPLSPRLKQFLQIPEIRDGLAHLGIQVAIERDSNGIYHCKYKAEEEE